MGKHKDKSKKHKKEKKHKLKKHQKRRTSTSSSASSSQDEWVEKKTGASSEEESNTPSQSARTESTQSQSRAERDEWMSLPSSFHLTESHLERRQKRQDDKRLQREKAQYNPGESSRELNPYWKDGGDGLPQFKKPNDDEGRKSSSSSRDRNYKSQNQVRSSGGWRKKEDDVHRQSNEKPRDVEESVQSEEDEDNGEEQVLTNAELNILASKLVKAEIMGNTKLVNELKEKLDKARKVATSGSKSSKSDQVLLTQTDSRGFARPLAMQSSSSDDYSRTGKNKRRRVETHHNKERMKYFADDDKYSLGQMFEREKFNSVHDQNEQFIKMATKVRKNDDLDEIFEDDISKEESASKVDARNRDRAINEHRKVNKTIDNCMFCLQSDVMAKHLMVSLGDTAYLSLPAFEPLTEGHCLIVPIRHVTCSTLLDENEWANIMDFRKAITRMFISEGKDVVFFESAKNLDNYPHMYIECVPVDKEEGDMAPIYFKKAIDECEAEWAQNKKLVSLKGKDVRRAVPKGLPYFFVSFGMEEGFAHVIEDEKLFPHNFAQEVIGGMLDLHHSKWRKPKMEKFTEQSARVVEFSKQWTPFDCTTT